MTAKEYKIRSPCPPWPIRYANVHWYKAPDRLVMSRRAWHKLDASAMVVILRGQSKAICKADRGSREVQGGPGDVLMWPIHAERMELNNPRDPLVAVAVYFRWDPWPEDLPFLVHDRKGVIRALADTLLLVKDADVPFKSQLQYAYLCAMVAEFIRLAREHRHPMVETVQRYTQEHMAQTFTLKDLAARVGLDPHHFGRRYKALTGHTPMEAVRRMRVEHARSTIRSVPRMALKDVAARAGVKGAGHLGKLFKRYLGVTSRDIRA